jgi:hypothetical protein
MHTPQGWFFTGIQAHVWPWCMGLFFPQALLYTNLTFPGWNTATACPHSKMWTYQCRWWFTLALQLHPTKAHKLAETEQETRNKKPNSPYKSPSKYQEGLSPQMKGVLHLFGVVFTVNHTLEQNPTTNFRILCVWNKNGQNRVPLKLSSECTYYLHFLFRRAASHQRNRQQGRLETQRPSRHPGSRTPNDNLPLQKTLS